MESKHGERIEALRSLIAAERVHGYWIPTGDEHLGEFIPPWAERRRWVSGFTGSSGDLVVGAADAWLFTDGRYRLQAAREAAPAGIQVHCAGRDPSLTQVVTDLARHRRGFRLGFDPYTVPAATAEAVSEELRQAGGALVAVETNLVDTLWGDRPSAPEELLRTVPVAVAGRSCADKVDRLRAELDHLGAEAWVTVKLDEIAWLTNLRAWGDVPFSTVFVSFLCVGPNEVHLFPAGGPGRVPGDALPDDFHIREYHDFRRLLGGLRGMRVALDPARVSAGVLDRLRHAGARLVLTESPVERTKAAKNSAEREAMRQANLRASAAITATLLWLREQAAAGAPLTEAAIAARVDRHLAAQPKFRGLSFATIAAAGVHSALPHYGTVDDTPLERDALFLLDTGAHIGGGTTDATRTVCGGEATERAREIYTRVLQAHLRLARQRFPAGTPGTALDAVARSVLWREGLDYEHGTGHGVGAGTVVHEGPFALAEEARKPSAIYPLREGMVTSVEPGYYEEGWGGVRLENLYIVANEEREGWLRLECLTWIPFAPDLIDRALLTSDEASWLNAYQQQCLERLEPLLDAAQNAALRNWIGEG